MAANKTSFEDDRLDAARLFAHTMIVIDDEASQQEQQRQQASGDTIVQEYRRIY